LSIDKTLDTCICKEIVTNNSTKGETLINVLIRETLLQE